MFLWVFSELLFRWSYPAGYADLEDGGAEGPLDTYLAWGLISIAINLLYFGGAYFFGDRAWAAARERAELDARTAELVAERERSASQAVALERVRIARELHDVVAHHVSVMGVQAGAARRILRRDPDGAAASLEAVEASARSAIDELRRMLGTLRAHGGEPSEAAAGPSTRGVERLAEIVDAAEQAGRAASLTVVGEPRALPGTVDVVAFRIAQEAVTNTVKHAGAAARIDVRLRYLPDAVEVEVADTGSGSRTAGRAGGAGLGHVGMRERVAAVGGSIEIGPRPRGGYLVRARLPAHAAVSARTDA
jgi:signal transduction histidine kinase